jgi:hypothetical protein
VVDELPIRVWRPDNDEVNSETDGVNVVYTSSVSKINHSTNTTLFSTAGKIVLSAVMDDVIYVAVKTSSKWTIYKINGRTDGGGKKIFESEDDITWRRGIKGDMLKDSELLKNYRKTDFILSEDFLIVGGRVPCLIYRQKTFRLSLSSSSSSSTWVSKLEFILSHTKSSPSLRIDKFSQLLNILPQTESSVLVVDEIKDILLHSTCTVVLLKNGDLIIYTKSGKESLLNKVACCTVFKNTLTAYTHNMGLYTASIKDIELRIDSGGEGERRGRGAESCYQGARRPCHGAGSGGGIPCDADARRAGAPSGVLWAAAS